MNHEGNVTFAGLANEASAQREQRERLARQMCEIVDQVDQLNQEAEELRKQLLESEARLEAIAANFRGLAVGEMPIDTGPDVIREGLREMAADGYPNDAPQERVDAILNDDTPFPGIVEAAGHGVP